MKKSRVSPTRRVHINIVSKRASGRFNFARVKPHPGVFTTWRGQVWVYVWVLSTPRGDTKKIENAHASHIHSQYQPCRSERCWPKHNPAAPNSALTKAQTITQTLGEAYAVPVKRRPRERAHWRLAPRLRPRMLQSRSYRPTIPRVHPPILLLERSVGPRGRQSYSVGAKLRVIEYTCLRCLDGGDERHIEKGGGRVYAGEKAAEL